MRIAEPADSAIHLDYPENSEKPQIGEQHLEPEQIMNPNAVFVRDVSTAVIQNMQMRLAIGASR